MLACTPATPARVTRVARRRGHHARVTKPRQGPLPDGQQLGSCLVVSRTLSVAECLFYTRCPFRDVSRPAARGRLVMYMVCSAAGYNAAMDENRPFQFTLGGLFWLTALAAIFAFVVPYLGSSLLPAAVFLLDAALIALTFVPFVAISFTIIGQSFGQSAVHMMRA